MNYIFWIFLVLLALQRLSELFYAASNEKILKNRGAEEHDKNGYYVIVLMHVMFFVSLVFEKIYFNRSFNTLSVLFFIIFVMTQFLRYWSIYSLGIYWNTKIIFLPGTEPVSAGPYRYMSHPNYLAVVVEIATIPLIFSCYFTAIIFSIINLLLLKRRIRIEEKVVRTK